MKKQVIVQGDVVIVLDVSKPASAKPRKDRTLALGEATGHHHTLETGTVYGELNGQQWIMLDEPTPLVHQEHGVLVIPPGVHEVTIEREYTPARIRRVID